MLSTNINQYCTTFMFKITEQLQKYLIGVGTSCIHSRSEAMQGEL